LIIVAKGAVITLALAAAELHIVNKTFNAASLALSLVSPSLSMTVAAKAITTLLRNVGCVSAIKDIKGFRQISAAYETCC